uniref:Calcineurin-like phosphoesterase domain-containing protein n=1 Tax=Hyaloperonospora arabidopsidis (strain Emoy2) TaxID=559515 RepID=M4BWE2_HYAAE
MGSGGDFERRRSELVLRQEVGDMNNVMDENVVKSYVDSVKEGGVLRDFLLHGNLAFVAHQTLFVHGGIINGDDGAGLSALGRVPDEPSKHFDSVLEWVDKLNAWYRSQIQDWIDYPHWNAKHSSRGGNELLKYVVPNYAGSVVVGRHLLAGGMPTPLPDKTASLLSKSGIRRVIIGHTPHGNCPTVIKQPQGQINTCPSDANVSRCHSVDGVSFEDVILCDTSYSDIQARDNRGSAASEVIVEPSGRVSVIGVLEDGQRIDNCT